MTPDWKEFLQGQGARIEADVVTDFGDLAGELRAARDQRVLADLSHWGLIGFSGVEAKTFLHGQFTNDLNHQLAADQAVFAAMCSPKGRMLANFLVLAWQDDILLLLPGELREAVQKRLSMFILRAKVKARDASAEWVRMGLAGPGTAQAVADWLGAPVADRPLAVGQAADRFAVRLGEGRFDLFTRPERAREDWLRFAAGARAVGAPAWDWLLVRAGVPTILARTQDEFVPQMANMDVLNGVSFNKGCYPGQEIVARTQYLGKLKKRLYLAHVDAPAEPGQPVFCPAFGEQAAGLVANAAPAPEGGTDLLVVLQIAGHDAGEVHLGAVDGPALAFMPLPYPL